MPKRAISITLDVENLTWLKARARATRARSVSDVLDRLVTTSRLDRRDTESRSVAGTIDVDSSDPLLLHADEAVRALVAESIGRPMLVKEPQSKYRVRRPRRGARG